MPLLSIIIPYYNGQDYIGMMLQSIVNQNAEFGEIEVVIADDCSTEPFMNVIKQYMDKVLIYVYKNKKHYGYPAPGRQLGAERATGEWLTFADQDDCFLLGMFDTFKKAAEKEDTFISSWVIHMTEDNEGFGYKHHDQFDCANTFTHGKFINRINLWGKYNLSYPVDLFTHEDTYIIKEIRCALFDKDKGTDIEKATYCWIDRKDSLSAKQIDKVQNDDKELHTFWYHSLRANGYMHLQKYKNGWFDYPITEARSLVALLELYFHHQFYTDKRPNLDLTKFEEVIGEYLRFLKKTLGLQNDTIFQQYQNHPDIWYDLRKRVVDVTEEFTETEGIGNWLWRMNYIGCRLECAIMEEE